MLNQEPEDSRIVSVRLPNTLVQALTAVRLQTTHRRRPTTRNAAMREALRLARPARQLVV
jgi:hypothetical protein